MKNYAEILGNIMRKKVPIMRKKQQIMRKFPTVMVEIFAVTTKIFSKPPDFVARFYFLFQGSPLLSKVVALL